LNLNLTTRFLKDHWRSALIVGLSVILYAALIGSLAPEFLDNPAFKKIIEQYPKAILAYLAGGTGGLNLFSYPGFWSAEFLQLWWVVMVGGLIIAYAAAALGTDLEQGTVETILTQPVGRATLILSRFAALAVYGLGQVVITMVSIAATTQIFGGELKTAGLVAVGLIGFVFILTIGSITLLISVIVNGRGRAVAWGAAVLLASHLLSATASLNATVEKFKWLSLFNYYRTQPALANGRVDWSDTVVLLVVGVVSLAAAILVFRRKDISVA